MVAGLLFVDTIFLTVWFALDPLKSEPIKFDEEVSVTRTASNSSDHDHSNIDHHLCRNYESNHDLEINSGRDLNRDPERDHKIDGDCDFNSVRGHNRDRVRDNNCDFYNSVRDYNRDRDRDNNCDFDSVRDHNHDRDNNCDFDSVRDYNHACDRENNW